MKKIRGISIRTWFERDGTVVIIIEGAIHGIGDHCIGAHAMHQLVDSR